MDMDLNLIYQDDAIIVCQKPVSLLSEQTPDHRGLADLLAEQNGGYIGVIHRLDRGVGGIMVYAKHRSAAAALSDAIRTHAFRKEYLAVVHGIPVPASDTWHDLLFHDRRQNKSFVVTRERAGVKEAVLDYTLAEHADDVEHGTLSLVRIRLHTGRTHQIRVQFASHGHALLGDGKYGAAGDRCPIALFSARLSFPHPQTGQCMDFPLSPTGTPWDGFSSLRSKTAL